VWLVKKLLITAAIAALAAAPAFAQQKTSLDQVMQELQALSARVGRLEQDNTQLKTENATLKSENDRLVATSEYLKDNAAATRKQLAEDGPKVAEAERIAKAAEWASRLSWRADLRYRHELVDPEEAVDEQTRQRIRARFAMTAKINDTLSGTIGLATNGGNNDQPDPRRGLDAQRRRARPRLRRLEADGQLRHELRQDAAALVQGVRLLLRRRH
jgi:regulator of replication initiation timing